LDSIRDRQDQQVSRGKDMDVSALIEQELHSALHHACSESCPPLLKDAMHHAVFPGGARVRPKLTLAVAKACGESSFIVAMAAAVSIEMLHCASLVHDDMPCFDNADLRRGKPSVHAQYGQALALMVGDGLIIQAFDHLARRLALMPDRLASVLPVVTQGVGTVRGIVAGQAWECEANRDLALYQQAKTGSLFAACTMAGAAAAGRDAAPWNALGLAIGEAFQVADDIRDTQSSTEEMGKPAQQDAANGRSNAVAIYGLEGAQKHFDALLQKAIDCIPDCPGRDRLCVEIDATSRRLVSGEKARQAA
jgi:geranylgeranyl diphosphate synthase, type II